MPENRIPKIALVGNPNSGKSSLFNQLTGLNQKTGNFPGVTVDKKTGLTTLPDKTKAEIIDLPGTYSIYPNTEDEKIVADILVNPHHALYPDKIVVIVDASNFKRNLLLFTQINDLGIPVILVLNMMDLVRKTGLNIDVEKLQEVLNIPVIPMEARSGKGINELKSAMSQELSPTKKPVFHLNSENSEIINKVKDKFSLLHDYRAFHLLQQGERLYSLPEDDKQLIREWKKLHNFKTDELRRREILDRYASINSFIDAAVKEDYTQFPKRWTKKFDKIFTHKIWGYVIFFLILFVIFQAIFTWATLPMDFIDLLFSKIASSLADVLPEGALTSLLTEGIIPGIGGIVIFIPQIAILFAFIAILEESGYMARVVFLMDRIMRKFGLNGKSVVPLISGVACAVPAIMATRTIQNKKERLLTIFVTPLMSCSARLPIYTILIALIIPPTALFGIFTLQGIALLALYLLGFLAAVFSAWIMKSFLKTREKSYLVMELPTYKLPRGKNIGITMYEKSRTFVIEAGKIILAISIILWVLASYGPPGAIDTAEHMVVQNNPELSGEALERKLASQRLEHSFAGYFGKAIEPVIEPLGYDWKMGIALITSFAAREVFVGTMATIYSIGDIDDEGTIKSRMRSEINPETGKARYDFATGLSLLVFYAFAMQCMSTFAVTYRETKTWRWPVLQLVYMTGLAYVCALVVYQVLK